MHTHTSFIEEIECTTTPVCRNINRMSLSQLWNRETYVNFRKKLFAFDFRLQHLHDSLPYAQGQPHRLLGQPHPACGSCLWAKGLIQCPDIDSLPEIQRRSRHLTNPQKLQPDKTEKERQSLWQSCCQADWEQAYCSCGSAFAPNASENQMRPLRAAIASSRSEASTALPAFACCPLSSSQYSRASSELSGPAAAIP